ncbi:MAG: disulfide bond formation protein B [Halobacteriaceae archaeon]
MSGQPLTVSRWDRGRQATGAAWLVATVATAGSLYYQFGLGLVPCQLCWFQRIAMYPLVVVLGYATLAGQRDPDRVVLPLSVPGLALAAYHSWLQVAAAGTCSFAGCHRVQYRALGLAIPNQSLLAFVLVTGLMAAVWWRRAATAED